MTARMRHPVGLLPEARKAMLALGEASKVEGVPRVIYIMVQLRASQINGCSYCVELHARELREAGEPDERIFTIAAWRDATFYTDAERAALALAEAVTRFSDRPDPVSDEVWNEAAKHFDATQLAGLLVSIGVINVWNRLNVATRQPARPPRKD